MKLDYTLQTAEERLQLVNQILEENPNPNEKYLEILADYLIIGFDKDKKRLVTPNREQTIAKRETSWEGLAEQFEQGEDSINGLIRNDKHILFRPKTSRKFLFLRKSAKQFLTGNNICGKRAEEAHIWPKPL